MKISRRTSSFQYAIRDVLAAAAEVEAKGHKVIKLNIGDPIKYGYHTPDILTEPLKYAKEGNYNFYADSQGLPELREQIANIENKKYNVGITADDVVITAGVSEGIQMTFMAFTNPGDRVLIPGAHYPSYSGNATIFEVDLKQYNTALENNWYPDPDDIRKLINKKTKLIFINSPNNPTGSVYPRKLLKEIVDICGEYDCALVSDETYDRLILDEGLEHVALASIAKDVPVITYNGFSKVFLAPGWRLGYTYIHDPEGKISEPWEGILKLCRLRLCAPTPLQKAGAECLKKEPAYLQEFIQSLRERRNLMYQHLKEMEGIEVFKPQAAFYIFPTINLSEYKWKNDREFVMDFLKKKHVLTVFGTGFGINGTNAFRMVYMATPEEIEEAMKRLEELLKESKL